MLSLKNVNVDIAGIPVLRQVNAEFHKSSIYAIVGRNGAGKTTFLRAVMGLIPVRSGEIFLDDQSLITAPSYTRASLGIGYAPEERVLFPTLTTLENLRLPCESLNLPRTEISRRIDEVVEVMPKIKELLPRSAAALSGGQGKMAALARSLMVGTHLILVDEPFQGLAPALAREFAEALSKIFQMRPELCIVITESNGSLLDRVDCTMMNLERGELTVELNQ
jgi:ABC-type branched-subunit amino acid transport system ATPase component